MYRGTTPTITLKLSTELDLTAVVDMFVTFKTGYEIVDVDIEQLSIDTEENKVAVTLTQEQTLALQPSDQCEVQVRFTLNNGYSYATNIATINVNRILKDGVIGEGTKS